MTQLLPNGADRASPARRDASMTLLTEVMQRPLDPGYAAAAAARAAADPDAARGLTRRRAPVTVLAALVVGLLLTAAILDLRVPSTSDARSLLQQEIEQRTAAADAASAHVERLRGEIEQAEVQALADQDATVLKVAKRLRLSAGAIPVTGPGVTVTLDNAPKARQPLAGDPRQDAQKVDIVLDMDLQIVVNGLWASGAEAIAINGQRLTSLSAIRMAGDAILVGFRPLAPPYQIQAIGDPKTLQTRFAASSAGAYLAFVQQSEGLRASVQSARTLDVPGAGTLKLRYARPTTSPTDDNSTEVVP
jgi:uncharacterized protein YlxW (UPF0749 family)